MPTTEAESALGPVITAPAPPIIDSPGTSMGFPAQAQYSDGVVIRGARWRFLVTDLDTVSITNFERLSRDMGVLAQRGAPWQASGNVPSDSPEVNIIHSDGLPFLHEGNRLLYGFRREAGGDPKWRCRFGGIILGVTDAGEQDPARSVYTAYDPWQYLAHRPVLMSDDIGPDVPGVPNGKYPGQMGWRISARPGNLIALQVLFNSWTTRDILGNGVAHIDLPWDYGGTGYYTGTIEETPILPNATDPWVVEQGQSVKDVWDALVSTGSMDIVLRPVYDPINRPGITSELSIYARAGVQRNGAVFAWDKPGRSLVGVNRVIDGTQRANKIVFHAGQGGVITGTPPEDAASIAIYDEYVLQQFFPDKPGPGMVEALAEQILALRARGLVTYALSPATERSASPLLEYEPGDTVPVWASANLRQEIGEYLRVESIPIQIDDNGVESVRSMLTSIPVEEEA